MVESECGNRGLDGYNPQRVMEQIRALSVPRRTGSAGEKKAVDYLTETFRAMKLPLSREKFTFSTFPAKIGTRLAILLLWLTPILALSLRAISTKGSAVVFFSVLVASFTGLKWNRFVERLYDLGFMRKESENLFAILKPEEVLGRIVLLTHYDSKSQSLPLYVRLILYTVFFVGLAGVSLLALIFQISGSDTLIVYLWAPSLLLTIPSFLLSFNFSGNRSPGGIDNASGVSLLIELARNLKDRGIAGIEVIFLFTGAEEEGLAGALRFMQGKGSEYHPHNTYFVNIDGIGAPGDIVLFSRHGFPVVDSGRQLGVVLNGVSRDAGISVHPTYFPFFPGLDHVPVAYRGFRAVSLSSTSLSRECLSIHTQRDSAGNVSADAVERGYALICALVRELERGVSA